MADHRGARYPVRSVQPAVFLDRDNTLIANDGDLGDPAQVRLLNGVAPGLRTLRDAGFRLVVVTNQGGVARGKYTEDAVDSVNQRIASLVDQVASSSGIIDRFYYCPYHPEASVEEYRRDHPWRKPHPGMILQAARDLRLDLARSWLIGDQLRDIQAGRAAGCRTILVSEDQALIDEARPTDSAATFEDAVALILRLREDDRPPEHNGRGAVDAPRLRRENASDDADRPARRSSGESSGESTLLRRAVLDLVEELRSERLHRADFTPLKLAAGIMQLLALLLVLLALLQLAHTDVFIKWMAGAIVAQLATITLLLAESHR